MVNKKGETPEYPKVIETFRQVGSWEINNWNDKEPSAFNGVVRVEKYRVTIEKVEEPVEVIQQRLEELWATCDNHHHWMPLQNMAKKFNYSFKSERGSKRKK